MACAFVCIPHATARYQRWFFELLRLLLLSLQFGLRPAEKDLERNVILKDVERNDILQDEHLTMDKTEPPRDATAASAQSGRGGEASARVAKGTVGARVSTNSAELREGEQSFSNETRRKSHASSSSPHLSDVIANAPTPHPRESLFSASGEGPHESEVSPEVRQQAMLPTSPPEVHPAAPVLQQEPQ